jgi:hypothetical protein
MSTCTWKAVGTLTAVHDDTKNQRLPKIRGVVSLSDGDVNFYVNEASLSKKLLAMKPGREVKVTGTIKPHNNFSSRPYFLTLLDIEPME